MHLLMSGHQGALFVHEDGLEASPLVRIHHRDTGFDSPGPMMTVTAGTSKSVGGCDCNQSAADGGRGQRQDILPGHVKTPCVLVGAPLAVALTTYGRRLTMPG